MKTIRIKIQNPTEQKSLYAINESYGKAFHPISLLVSTSENQQEIKKTIDAETRKFSTEFEITIDFPYSDEDLAEILAENPLPATHTILN